MAVLVKVAPDGRMRLPTAIRKRLGFEGCGGTMLVEETEDGVVLRTVAQVVARAQVIASKYADHPDASVDAFIAHRRRSAASDTSRS